MNILHIEDCDADSFTVERVLKGSTNRVYNLHRMRTMGEAIEALKSEIKWDIILLDLELPDTKGRIDTFMQIESAKSSDIPVLILTGMNDHELALNLVDNGAEDFVNKSIICENERAFFAAIDFAVHRHKNFKKEMTQKQDELSKKDDLIQWMTGSYSVMR